MVAGIKGVVFLNEDEIAVSSSTEGEVFVISISNEKVLRSIKLGTKVESLSVVPNNRKILLVAEADGHIRQVDLNTEPATIICAATIEWGPTRLTSVAAYDENISIVAGAEKNNKTNSAIWLLRNNEIIQPAIHECDMVRALLAEPDQERFLIGAIDTSDKKKSDAITTILETRPPFLQAQPLGKIGRFVHSIARKEKSDIYVVLTRHGDASACEPPIKLVRLSSSKQEKEIQQFIPFLIVQAGIRSTLPITMEGIISTFTLSVFLSAILGLRSGREHAMALHPDGDIVVTGNVDKSSKGILQIWHLHDIRDHRPFSSSLCCCCQRRIRRLYPPPNQHCLQGTF